MSDAESPASPDDLVAHSRNDAGAQLRAAREVHGLSIETVAQQLKLAPRQVRALEEGDASQLPGRTFIRGFARNYARLLQLDAESIVAALPDAEAVVVADPTATPTRPMGELPPSQPRERPAWPRMALLLVMAALAAVAAYYELGLGDRLHPADSATLERAKVERPADPIGPPPGDAIPLPNPVVPAAPQPGGSAPTAAADPTTLSGPLASPTTTLPITAANMPALPPASAGGTATLVIRYAGPAWTEVRDANGQRLLLVTGTPGTSETVNGTPPFELTLGNATQVGIDWRGAAFDLAPHIKANVARVRLP